MVASPTIGAAKVSAAKGLVMKTRAMIIHLDRATARRAQVAVLQDMLPLPAEVVAAVDAQLLSDPQTQAYCRKLARPYYPFALRLSEIAIFMSHRRCWQKIIDEELDAALILEDDLELDAEIFPRALSLTQNNLRPGDFVRFPIKQRGTVIENVAVDGSIKLQSYDQVGLGTQGQLVTYQAAKALLAASEQFDRPVDDFIKMQWLHEVRVLTVWPSGVQEISGALGGSLNSSRTGGLEKLRREVLRPLYRHRMARRARQYHRTDN